MKLSREQLRQDLMKAYLDARKHKRRKPYQQLFEARLERNINELTDELFERRYRSRPSHCFLINDPKLREIFAADFRDRIVHHLYYNYVYQMLQRTFVYDSYSCIKHRGTHFGINRLEKHIRQESRNYQQKCYVMKMDIKGYFIHINREKLLTITLRRLSHISNKRLTKGSKQRWKDVLDMDFIYYLSQKIILLDPTQDCIIHGDRSSWNDLPKGKSLFCTKEGCGLPIGNLTSQLLSNVYLGELDDFVKRHLKVKHYGRYVDDFYIVSASRSVLHLLLYQIKSFLQHNLALSLNQGKTIIRDVAIGIEFLGAYLKPYRRYIANRPLLRMQRKNIRNSIMKQRKSVISSINSMLGTLCHYSSFNIQKRLFLPVNEFWYSGYYSVCRRGLIFRSCVWCVYAIAGHQNYFQ